MGRGRSNKQEKTEAAYLAEAEKLAYKGILTPKQIAVYLSQKSLHKIYFDERTVRGRIEQICALSGSMTVDDFKQKEGRRAYQFKPEWHGLLFALMDTHYFDDRKNDRLLSTREQLYRELVENIENYLSEEDRKIVKSYPGYQSALCEETAADAITGQIQILIRDAMHSDETIRLKLLRRIHDTLNDLIKTNQKDAIRIWTSKLVYQRAFGTSEEGNVWAGVFRAESLPAFIAGVLASKVKETDFREFLHIEQLNYPNVYDAAKIDDPVPLPKEGEGEAFNASVRCISEGDERYQCLIQKLQSVMNLEDPTEKQLYKEFAYLAYTRFHASALDKEMLERGLKSFETAMQKDIFDLMQEFANGAWQSSTITTLQRIQAQRRTMQNQMEAELDKPE